MAKRLVLVGLFIAFVVGGSFWSLESHKSTDSKSPQASQEFYACNGCKTVGVKFDQPLQLSDIESLATANKGNVISLWRQDSVCVATATAMLPTQVAQKHSQFAYFEADAVVQRQADKGPPVTDGGYSFKKRDEFVEEWQKANQPGVKFLGAVLLVANSVTGPHVQTTAPIDSYITDGANVVYLRGHEQAMAPLFMVDSSNC